MGFLKRIKKGLKIILNKDKYFTIKEYENIIREKEKEIMHYKKRNDYLIKTISNNKKKYGLKHELVRKKAYTKGCFDGYFSYSFNIRKKTERTAKEMGIPEKKCGDYIEEILEKIRNNEESVFENPKLLFEENTNSVKKLFDYYCNKIISCVSEYDKKTKDKVKKGIHTSLINYLLLCTNYKSFNNYGILDTSYLSRYKEINPLRRASPGLLCPGISGLIIPSKIIEEYYDAINYHTDNRVKRVIKDHITQLFFNNNIILIPEINNCLDDDILEIFDKQYADLQILSFYKKYGDSFNSLKFLVIDMDLEDEVKKESENFKNHKIEIVNNPPKK